MARATVKIRVHGYKETFRALDRVNRGAKKSLMSGLKDAAEPIAADARGLLAGYAGLSTGTIGPRAVSKGVYITQRAKKRTGFRPDFGALQMTHGLLPALAQNEDDIESKVEDAFIHLTNMEGF